MSDEFRKNLMGPEPTLLPAETEIYQHLALGNEALDLVAKNPPTSSLLWAILAEEAWAEGRTIESYAYARVGYHRAWIPCAATVGAASDHPVGARANQGFLRALYALGRAASAIGEAEEPERIEKFLNDSDPKAKAALEAR